MKAHGAHAVPQRFGARMPPGPPQDDPAFSRTKYAERKVSGDARYR